MAIDDLGREVATDASARDRWIAVYIGALAVVLAICALGGENASKEATLSIYDVTHNFKRSGGRAVHWRGPSHNSQR